MLVLSVYGENKVRRTTKEHQKTLKGVETGVTYWIWTIENHRQGGAEVSIIIQSPTPIDGERWYKDAPTHKRFVGEGVIVYLISEIRLKYTDEQLKMRLQTWRAGQWKHTDLRSQAKRARTTGAPLK